MGGLEDRPREESQSLTKHGMATMLLSCPKAVPAWEPSRGGEPQEPPALRDDSRTPRRPRMHSRWIQVFRRDGTAVDLAAAIRTVIF